MKRFLLVLLLGLVFAMSACTTSEEDSGEVTVYSSLFPQYDVVRALAGDYVNNEFLLSSGVDAHSYEPSPRTVADIFESDALIYTNAAMEPWISTFIEEHDNYGYTLLNISSNIETIGHDDDHDDAHDDDHDEAHDTHDTHDDDHDDAHDDDHDDHDHGDYDPHVWTSPQNMVQITRDIEALLLELVPEHSDVISQNADEYVESLNELDSAFHDTVESTELDSIMLGGHNALGYFTEAYGLELINPYRGFSTDSEPTSQAIGEMIDTMKANEIEHLFSEHLIYPDVADIISEETGAEILYLYNGANLGTDDFDSGMGMIDIFEHNLEKVRIGLGYSE